MAAADGGGAWWFQVYVMRDRDLTARLAGRAVAAGARALVLTGDTPVVGRKRRDRGDGVVSEAEFTVNIGPLDGPGPTGAGRGRDVRATSAGWPGSAACRCWSRVCCGPTTRAPAWRRARPG